MMAIDKRLARLPAGQSREPHQETDAIVSVIRDGTSALRQRDFDAWAGTWVQDDHVRRVGQRGFDAASIDSGAGLSVGDGWENIWPVMKRIIDDESVAIYPNGTQCENWYVRVKGDTAWVTFDQYPLDSEGRPAPETIGHLRETRMLEKHSNRWKITYVGYFHEVPHLAAKAVVRVDQHAMIIGMTRPAAERIGNSEALRVSNGRLRAADRDVDTRLLVAIRDSSRARPWKAGAAGVPFLVKTPWGASDCVCWISSSLDVIGSVVIVIGDALGSRRHLQKAILVYRLSPAQARLAAEIIGGRDLVAAAERLGVTVNTARTHLQRMFEKTGVRSQPALIGALLSVSTPLAV